MKIKDIAKDLLAYMVSSAKKTVISSPTSHVHLLGDEEWTSLTDELDKVKKNCLFQVFI